MYIEQAYKSLHDGWRYIIGFLIVFIFGWQLLGVIPLGVVSFLRAGNVSAFFEASLQNFMPLFEGKSNLYLALIIFTFIGGLIALLLVIKYLHRQKFTELVTARKKIDWGRVFFSFGVWATFSIIITVIGYYASPEDFQWNFNLLPFLGLLAVTLLLLPLQTSFEELLFRGYLMQGIGANLKESKSVGVFTILMTIFPFLFLAIYLIFDWKSWVMLLVSFLFCALLYPIINLFKTSVLLSKLIPLLFTSVIFGFMHAFNPEIEKLGYSVLSVYIGLGFFLGIITLMDDGMELALGFHASNNMIIALLVTSDWTALQTNSVFLDVSEPSAIGQIVPIFIILPILTFIFAKKYKWSGWREKLLGKVSSTEELPETIA